LFGTIGPDRVAAVSAAANASGSVIVLKGAETIIAAPDGRIGINLHAAPWLATAGSGDVLTGIIAALIAQGMALFDAARAGVWLHGDAGRRGGPGVIADDLPGLMPAVLAAL
jgi:NAD(P)H-hydrate epimerase